MTVTHPAAITALASCIAGVRMIGLFLLLPIFAPSAHMLFQPSALVIGVAIGIYGATQALLQIPLGRLSDSIGRKPVILFGLCLFIIGSSVCAISDNMTVLIVGRALQGCGAISATVLALLADTLPAEQHTKAMACVGISVGGAFLLSMMTAPLLVHVLSFGGFFWVISALGVIAFVCALLLPEPIKRRQHIHSYKTIRTHSKKIATLALSAALIHTLLTVNFMLLPGLFIRTFSLPLDTHTFLYAPVMIISVIGMIILFKTTKQKETPTLTLCIASLLIVVGQGGLFFASSSLLLCLGMLLVFFVGFNAAEALIPSLASKITTTAKGTVLGIVNSAQFFGACCGGIIGGYLQTQLSTDNIFVLFAVFACAWSVILFRTSALHNQQ